MNESNVVSSLYWTVSFIFL